MYGWGCGDGAVYGYGTSLASYMDLNLILKDNLHAETSSHYVTL